MVYPAPGLIQKYMQRDRIAVIDLGTNTFHLLIAEVGNKDEFVVKGKFKEEVNLGEGGLESGVLTQAAFERGIEVLKGFRKLIEGAGVTQVQAFATSAIRSASNGDEFVQQAREEAGIDIRVINGNMEAAYIHEGVKNGVQLPENEAVLLVDIGGGSVEFIVSQDGQPMLLRSLNIGGARILARLHPEDPFSEGNRRELHQIFREELKELIAELKEFDLKLLVGSSGTFEALAELIAHRRGDFLSADNLNGYHFDHTHAQEMGEILLRSTREERREMDGMDAGRVDLVVVGVVLIQILLDELSVKDLMVSTSALKEGILFRYLKDKRHRVARFIGLTEQNLRARSVKQLAEKYHYDQTHSLKVSELAGQMFEQLQGLHGLGRPELEMLQYAAVLHDIGHYIHPSGHHKHGQYLIMNTNPYGFSTNELVLLANVVRYHRKSLPSREHYHYVILPDREKGVIHWLAGILRIADNLDRGHRNMVEEVIVHYSDTEITLEVSARDDVSKEIDYANEEKTLLEITAEMPVRVMQLAEKIRT